jgi:hypothetical protein
MDFANPIGVLAEDALHELSHRAVERIVLWPRDQPVSWIFCHYGAPPMVLHIPAAISSVLGFIGKNKDGLSAVWRLLPWGKKKDDPEPKPQHQPQADPPPQFPPRPSVGWPPIGTRDWWYSFDPYYGCEIVQEIEFRGFDYNGNPVWFPVGPWRPRY